MKGVKTMRFLKKYLLMIAMTVLMIGSVISIDTFATVNVTISGGKVSLSNDSGITSKEAGFEKVIENYKELITFFGGIATMSFVVIFMKHFVELGAKANNPMERRQIASGLLWAGLAAALLGSVTFVFAMAYNVFR